MTERRELELCRVCAGSAIEITADVNPLTGDDQATIRCEDCGHSIYVPLAEEEAIRLWNTRATRTPPEGYVLVPVEPTHEMMLAALNELSDVTVESPKATAWDALRAYKAMLAAASEKE